MDFTAPRTQATDTSTPWLPVGLPERDAVTLLCFPHAGAGASAFRTWDEHLSSATVCPVQFPGREGRFADSPFHTVEPLVDAALEALVPVLHGPFAVFGHSMGALVAYEFTRGLRRTGGPLPLHVFVSGRVAPQVRNPVRGLHELPEPEFIRFVHSMGGVPERTLNSRAFAELMVPLLRADISVNETYEHQREDPLDVPLTALAGQDDARVPLRWVQPWSEHTTKSFALHVLPGGHFFPYEERDGVLHLIDNALRESV
ncbi:thioesterase [Streptomyces tuirus]|uniref:Thioesterase n=1 Tax=Streptomyces tuirus TaxID=68278 RepID=A0A941J2C7_9ACTN|nr:thioesterase [Streptomyces tuirus]